VCCCVWCVGVWCVDVLMCWCVNGCVGVDVWCVVDVLMYWGVGMLLCLMCRCVDVLIVDVLMCLGLVGQFPWAGRWRLLCGWCVDGCVAVFMQCWHVCCNSLNVLDLGTPSRNASISSSWNSPVDKSRENARWTYHSHQLVASTEPCPHPPTNLERSLKIEAVSPSPLSPLEHCATSPFVALPAPVYFRPLILQKCVGTPATKAILLTFGSLPTQKSTPHNQPSPLTRVYPRRVPRPGGEVTVLRKASQKNG
jgi:hypothetical protein